MKNPESQISGEYGKPRFGGRDQHWSTVQSGERELHDKRKRIDARRICGARFLAERGGNRRGEFREGGVV